jgi:hypothetical protein
VAVEEHHVVQAAPQPVVKPARPAAAKPAPVKKQPKTVVRNAVPQSVAPVAEEPKVVAASEPEPVPAQVVEPAVVAREVTSRATSTSSSPRPAPKVPSSRSDLDKKRMRAWALLSDWPSDRPRNAETLASAIASTVKDAADFITQYDAEHGTSSNLTLVANSQN